MALSGSAFCIPKAEDPKKAVMSCPAVSIFPAMEERAQESLGTLFKNLWGGCSTRRCLRITAQSPEPTTVPAPHILLGYQLRHMLLVYPLSNPDPGPSCPFPKLTSNPICQKAIQLSPVSKASLLLKILEKRWTRKSSCHSSPVPSANIGTDVSSDTHLNPRETQLSQSSGLPQTSVICLG